MADPSPSDLISLLARYGADGILEAPQVLSAIRAMSGDQAVPDLSLIHISEPTRPY